MAARSRRRGSIAAGLMVWLIAGLTSAGPLEVKSSHPTHPDLEAYLWLKTTRMMRLEISGPTHLGLRLREVLVPGRPPAPVDLTVVRDDAEQGTVRFNLPPGTGSLSGEVLVRIDVPEGAHTYRLLVSGPDLGVVLQAFSGAIRDDRSAIVATPGGDRVDLGKQGPRRKPKPQARPLAPAEEEVLGAVEVHPPVGSQPRTYQLIHRPSSEGLAIGPKTRTLGSLAGVMLLGATTLAISGGVQESRAKDEPVQVRAGLYFDRADRTNQAALTLAILGGAALVSTLVYYYLEAPAGGAGDQVGMAVLRF